MAVSPGLPNNALINVQTYQKCDMAYLINTYVGIGAANKKYQNFQDKPAQLGQTVTFELAPRARSVNGLVVVNQPSVQRFQTLSATQAANSTTDYTAQQLTYNIEQYIEEFNMAGAQELGTQIETDVLRTITTGVIGNDPQTPSAFGVPQTYSGPFRFFGNGTTAINSFGQLAKALTNFRQFGAVNNNFMGILPENVISEIVNTGLQQFTLNRNDELADSWMLGRFSNCTWAQSNLLPTHISGTIGDAGSPNNIVTVVSTNDPKGQNVTQITFTEPTAGTQTGAVKIGDLFQSVDGVAGQPNLRFLTWIGHALTPLPVQFVAIADSDTSAGTFTVQLRTSNDVGLSSAFGQNQNLNTPIVAGMKFQIAPSHQAGVIWSGNPLYLAMPELPDQFPFPTANKTDKESGASIRHYAGTVLGQNQQIYVRDAMWGVTLIPEQCMRVLFPLN